MSLKRRESTGPGPRQGQAGLRPVTSSALTRPMPGALGSGSAFPEEKLLSEAFENQWRADRLPVEFAATSFGTYFEPPVLLITGASFVRYNAGAQPAIVQRQLRAFAGDSRIAWVSPNSSAVGRISSMRTV